MSLTITLLAAVRASEIGPSACYGVFARSFRERKLEFLSAQHVKLGSGSFARKTTVPCFVCAKLSKQTKGTRGLASGSLPWQYDQGTLQSSRPDHRGARRQGRATAAG
jgi:hypothetical protein